MARKLFACILFSVILSTASSQVPQPIRQLIKTPNTQGASFAFIAKDVETGEILYEYDADRLLTPASVLKTVTTATALDLLGEDYHFTTLIQYEGEIKEGVLYGNVYIKGSGDPTLGSSHFASGANGNTSSKDAFVTQWVSAIRKEGIRRIVGSIIADESVFDTEGVAPKWVWEDMGSYFGAGSYGLNVFDNILNIHLSSGGSGERPAIKYTDPDVQSLVFHNYLTSAVVATDSSYILGAPFSNDRYLYGVVPAKRSNVTLRGDIPDPALFLAMYLKDNLERAGVNVEQECTSYRILSEAGKRMQLNRKTIYTTKSPSLKDIIRIANEKSHNLYTDALLKTLGVHFEPETNEVISSFGKGINVVRRYWKGKGLNIDALQMSDGSGLSRADKVSVRFITDVLAYMSRSSASSAFYDSLPLAGSEGSVRNFLKGTQLQGKAKLKSGGMSSVRCYAGYIPYNGRRYAVALFANNYYCEGADIIRALEKLLVSLF